MEQAQQTLLRLPPKNGLAFISHGKNHRWRQVFLLGVSM